jgi:class 3 adenylate cyclase
MPSAEKPVPASTPSNKANNSAPSAPPPLSMPAATAAPANVAKPPPPPSPKPVGPPLFDDVQVLTKEVLVLIYDFENFTTFLSIPDIHRDVPRYLSFVDREVKKVFLGGKPMGTDYPTLGHSGSTIIHEKFLGDGVMLIAELPENEKAKLASCENICAAAWNLKQFFNEINHAALEFMPVTDLPQRIRFGITYGTVLELTRPGGSKEYVGYPINLAARLQKYAGSASFLASARLPKSHLYMPNQNFLKVKAKALRGRKDELVYIDPDDFEAAMQIKEEEGLFESVGPD